MVNDNRFFEVINTLFKASGAPGGREIAITAVIRRSVSKPEGGGPGRPSMPSVGAMIQAGMRAREDLPGLFLLPGEVRWLREQLELVEKAFTEAEPQVESLRRKAREAVAVGE